MQIAWWGSAFALAIHAEAVHVLVAVGVQDALDTPVVVPAENCTFLVLVEREATSAVPIRLAESGTQEPVYKVSYSLT